MDASEKPPRLSYILETSLYVDDLQVSRDFYSRIFGFEEFGNDGRLCIMGVPGGQVLLLFKHGSTAEPAGTPGGVIPPHGAQGHLHLCFAIPRGELERWEQHLERQQLAIESRVTWPRGGVSLYFRDPDGHSLEVATPGLWPNY
jgi:catechol 2,3-dioxygenase-like lactoylglutathione lyase family enzyme